jgi:hypothetical protein
LARPARDDLRRGQSGCGKIKEQRGYDVLVISGEAAVTEYLNLLGNAIVDRSPEELIGAVAIALTISLAMAGIYCIGRRKITENLMPMIVLMIVANLVSMAVGAGHFHHARKKIGYVEHEPIRRPPNGPGGSNEFMVEWIFREADRNHDRQISGEEASLAAAEFLRRVDASGKGTINPRTLDRALQGLMFYGRFPHHPPSPFQHPGLPPPEFSGPGSPPDRSLPRIGPPSESGPPGTNQSKGPFDVTIRPESVETHLSG